MKINLGIACALLLCAVVSPALSQDYHYSYGGTRVINQNAIGLAHPAATQIGGGTLSPSAQGVIQQSEQNNPGLPKVPWGSHVTTPGDVQYQNNFSPQAQVVRVNSRQVAIVQPVMVAGPPTAAPTANTGLPGTPMGSHIGTAGDSMRSDLHPEVNRYNDMWWHHPAYSATRRVSTNPSNQYVLTGSSGAATYNDGQSDTHKLSY
jgi:hypothetical protein